MDSGLPPLPAGSPGRSVDSEISSSLSRATRRHRRHSTIEREINHLRDLLQSERRRADEAETRTGETLAHLKTINDARLKALQEAAQATEKLKLYQIQLEAAQQEIYRAQDVLDAVDKQRLDAEKEAAELRSKNRKLLEDAKLQRAREQGRLQGVKEGLEKGRDLGLLEGRLMGYSPYPPPQQHDRYDVHDGTAPSSPDSGVSHRSHSRSQTPRPSSRTSSVAPSVVTSRFSVDTHGHQHSEAPIPVPPPTSASRHSSTQNLSHGSQSSNHTAEHTRPVSVRNKTPSVVHPSVPIPPDNYIPHLDADNVIRLPPPHDFQRTSSRTDRPVTPPHDSESEDRNHRSRPGTSYRRSHRHSSPESDSTTLSQMDLVNDPIRDLGLRTPMSAIEEVSSSQASPDPEPPSNDQGLRRQPSFASSTRTHRSQRSTVTAAVTPQGDATDLRAPIYTRPRPDSGSTMSITPSPQVPQHQSSQSTLGSVPPISVHPPSSPSSIGTASIRPQQMENLSPNRQPTPLPSEPPNINPSSSSHTPQQPEFSSPIVLGLDQLPPNFVPMGYTPASTYAPLQPLQEAANTSSDGPPVIPDSALFGASSSEDSDGGSSVETLTTPPPSQRHLGQQQQQQRSASNAGSHFSASHAPGSSHWGGSTVGGAAQVPLPPSTVANTPRWEVESTIIKAPSAKSRSTSRNTKR